MPLVNAYPISTDGFATTEELANIVVSSEYTNTGNAVKCTVTKFSDGTMIITANGFYATPATSVPYELTWNLPEEFVDNVFVVFGIKGSTGSYKRGATVKVMEIVDTSSVILQFDSNDIPYNLTAIGRWQ